MSSNDCPKLICPKCGREYRSCDFKRHLKSHETHQQYQQRVLSMQHVQHKGLNCVYCGKLCKNKNSLAQHECRCKENPNRYLVKGTNNLKNINWRKGLTKETDIRILHNIESVKNFYKTHEGPFKGKHHTDEVKQKLREQQQQIDHANIEHYSYCKKGYYQGIFFMSSWELAYYIYMRDHGHSIVRCTTKYVYKYNGKEHMYTPDFILDNKFIVEIKGYETKQDLEKYKSVESLIIVKKKDMLPILNFVKTNYAVDDISQLYDN